MRVKRVKTLSRCNVTYSSIFSSDARKVGIMLSAHAVGYHVYLTRDYYDGFINDRVKYGSGKI